MSTVDKERKQIILTPNDEILHENYAGYESLSKGVGGCIGICTTQNIPIFPKPVKADFYCNDEFLLINDEKFSKCNAIATLLSGQPIYGNVVIVKNIGEDNIGFEYLSKDGEEEITETWMIEDALMRFKNDNIKNIEQIHEEYDNNKPEPHFEFYEWDDVEEGRD